MANRANANRRILPTSEPVEPIVEKVETEVQPEEQGLKPDFNPDVEVEQTELKADDAAPAVTPLVDGPDQEDEEEEEEEEEELTKDDFADLSVEDKIVFLKEGAEYFKGVFIDVFGDITAPLFEPILNILKVEEQKFERLKEPEVDEAEAIKANQERANAELERIMAKRKKV